MGDGLIGKAGFNGTDWSSLADIPGCDSWAYAGYASAPDGSLWIAGGVNWSAIMKFDGQWDAWRARRPEFITQAESVLDYHALPHLSKTNHTVCVIGTAGGEDSLAAIGFGARHVTGIDMDPMIAYFVTNTYSAYAGGLFTDGTNSELVVDEGRSYIRRSGRKFDIIQQVNNFTPIAFQNGALNLSEAYLLTVESFREFYDHLTDDGLPGDEGAFLLCTFWLADCLHLLGRTADARALYEKLVALRNDVGLLSEEYDPSSGRLLGNLPQAFSHVALVNTAMYLGDEGGHAAARRAHRR